MAHRMSKLEAAAHLEVSASTIDRMIQKGELQIEKEPHGSRHRIWVVMDAEESDESVNSSRGAPGISLDASPDESGEGRADGSDTSGEVELAVLRERVKNLEELADYHRDLLKDSEWRYQQAMEQLGASQRTVETLTKALPAADAGTPAQRRRWWPFGRR